MAQLQTTDSDLDLAFIKAFESCRLPANEFGHRDHIRLAWLYLRRYPVAKVLDRLSTGIKSFASFHGAADKYHETITWAYILLINERMEQAGRDLDWQSFVAGNEDLFSHQLSVLDSYYPEDVLSSPLARSVFVLPRRVERPKM